MQFRTQRPVPISGSLPEADHDVWKPTAPSLGSREPQLRSRYSSTGFIVHKACVVNFESRPERFAAEVFALDPDIVRFVEQPPRIAYRDGDTWAHHTFDFLTIRATRVRTLVAIKNSRRVEGSGIRKIIRLISEQVGRAVADEIILLTERDFTAVERFNAELAHEVMRAPVPEHDEHVRQISAEIRGSVACRFFRLAEKDCRVEYDARIRRC
jgi:hypothetical protein